MSWAFSSPPLVYALYANSATNPLGGCVDTSSDLGVFGNAQLPLNTWRHMATTYDGARLRLYVNGLQVGSRSLPGSIRTSGDPLRIGGNSVWGEHFQGSIDEVHIYNYALLASEIQADMNTATVATTSGVLSVQNSGVPQNLGGILSALGKSTPPLGSAGPQTANGASRSSASTTTTTTSDLLTSDHVVVGEVMVDHQWKRVALGKPFTDSVVVVKALSYRDAALAVVKIRQTDATGFALRLQPRDESSRSHVSETVGYLVIERGCFRLADGTSLETRTVDTDPEYPVYSIAFSQAFRGVLMVMTGLTNTQEPMAVTGRPTLISEKGLQFQLQPQGPSPGLGALQTVSYVAWELSMAPLTASPSRSTRGIASHGGSFLPSYSRKSLLMPRCFSRISSAVKEVAQSM